MVKLNWQHIWSYPHFTYVTTRSPTLPLLHLRHCSFSNPSFVSPISQALHLIHLASRPWTRYRIKVIDKRLHLQSMRNNLRQNFQGRQKMCLHSLSIMMLTALVLPLLHFCEETVLAYSFHCGVTTNFIFILTIHISMGGSPGDVSQEPVT